MTELWAPTVNQALRLDSTALLLIATTQEKEGGRAPLVAGEIFCCFMTLFFHTGYFLSGPSSFLCNPLFSLLLSLSSLLPPFSLNRAPLNNSHCIQ